MDVKQENNSFPILSNLRYFKLDNGLRIYVYPNHRAPAVTVQAWMETGSIHEQEYLGCGLSHFLEHMLFCGTKKYPGKTEISDKASALGCELNAYTSYSKTVYYMSGPDTAAENILDMLCDMLRNPLFPEELFRREKQVILQEASMIGDRPVTVLFQKVLSDMFRVSPFRHPIIGYPSCIEKVTRNMMADYWKRRYAPQRCFFVVCGDVAPEQVRGMIEERLGDWEIHGLEAVVPASEPVQASATTQSYVFHDTLARFAMGFHAPAPVHKDIPALTVLLEILAGAESSRIPWRLQVEKELANDVEKTMLFSQNEGIMLIYGSGNPETIKETAQEAGNVINEIIENGIKQEELDRVVHSVKATKMELMRSMPDMADAVGSVIHAAGTPNDIDRSVEMIQSLTVQDIQNVAKKYFAPDLKTLDFLVPELEKTNPDGKGNLAPFQTTFTTLSGGQKLIHTEDPDAGYVGLDVRFPGGMAFETPETSGYTALLLKTIFCGTEDYTEEEFNRLLDDYAIQLSMTPGATGINLNMESLAEDFDAGLKLTTSMLARPTFSAKEFEREKKMLIEGTRSRMLSPQGASVALARSLRFGADSPMGIGMDNILSSIEKATPDGVRSFYQNDVLCSDKCSIAISGKCTKDQAVQIAEKLCSAISWSHTSKVMPSTKDMPEGKTETVTIPRNQAIPLYVLPFPGSRDPQYQSAKLIISQALNGMSSPLFDRIREQEGLAYFTAATILPGTDRDGMIFFAGTDPANAERVLTIFQELHKLLAKEGITEIDFESARNKALYDASQTFADAEKVALDEMLNDWLGLGPGFSRRSMDALKKADYHSVNEDIKKIFSCASGRTGIVLPSARAEGTGFNGQ